MDICLSEKVAVTLAELEGKSWLLLSRVHLTYPMSTWPIIFLKQVYIYATGSEITSDWLVNSFIMVLYETFFKVQSKFSVQSSTKKILIDNHFKSIYERNK